MKTIDNLLLLSCFWMLLSFSTLAIAEESAPSGFDPEASVRNLMARIEAEEGGLELSEAQKVQVREILQTSAGKIGAVLDRYGIGPDNPPSGFGQRQALAYDLRPIRQEREDALSKVLDERQLARLEEIRKQLRQEMKAQRRYRER